MINQSFLQIFFQRNPDAEQVIRQAIHLDTQTRFHIARGNAARTQGDHNAAYDFYTTAIDMAETANHLRKVVADGTWQLFAADPAALDLFPSELARVA